MESEARGRANQLDSLAQGQAELLHRIARLEAVPDDPVLPEEPPTEPDPQPFPPPVVEWPDGEPTERERLEPGDLEYLGHYTVPALEDNGCSFWNSGNGIAVDGERGEIYLTGQSGIEHVCRMKIPAEFGKPLAPIMTHGHLFFDPSGGTKPAMDAEDGDTGSHPRVGGMLFDDGELITTYHGHFGASQAAPMICAMNRAGDVERFGPYKRGTNTRISQQKSNGWITKAPEWWCQKHDLGSFLLGNVPESIRGAGFEGPGAFAMFDDLQADLVKDYPGNSSDASEFFYDGLWRNPTKADRWNGVFIDDGKKACILFVVTFGHRNEGQSYESQYYLPWSGVRSHMDYPGFQGYHAPPYTAGFVLFDADGFVTADPQNLRSSGFENVSEHFLEIDHVKPYTLRSSATWDGVTKRLYVKEHWPGRPEPVVHAWGIR